MIELVLIIVIAGLIVWGVGFLPIPQPFKVAVYVIVAICLIVFVLRAFGLLDADVPVPQVR